MTRHRTGGKPLSQPMLTHSIDAYMRRFGRWVSNPYICKKYTYIAAQFAIVCDIYWCKNKSSDKAMKLYIIENNVTEYLFFTWCVSKTLDFVTWVYRNIYHWKMRVSWPLQWRHMSITSSTITDNAIVCPTISSGVQQRKPRRHWPFVRGIHWAIDSYH